MKRTLISLLAVLFAATVFSPIASARFLKQWGDFAVADSAQTLPVWAFDDGRHVNPPDFPSPTRVGTGAYYPEQFFFSNVLTVQTLRDYMAEAGADDGSFGLLFRTGDGWPTILYDLSIYIGGVRIENVVAGTHGRSPGFFMMPPNSTRAFFPDIDLRSYSGNENIIVSYVGGISSNIQEVQLAHVPEPVSVAFLATGLVGTILLRFRRRRTGKQCRSGPEA